MSGSRSPRTCSQKRCSAIMVAFDSSSPTHQPPGCWSSSSRALPFSTAVSSLVSSSTAVIRSAPARRRRRSEPQLPSSPASLRQPRRRRGQRSASRSASSTAAYASRDEQRRSREAHGSPATRAALRRPVGRSARRPSGRPDPRPRTSSRSGTPLETTVRYWPPSGGEWPVSAPRSKTQWAGLSSSAASRWWRIGRSKSRWTLTIGESSSAGGSAPSSRAASAAGEGDDHGVGIELVERLDPRLQPDVGACLAQGVARCVAVHRAERLRRGAAGRPRRARRAGRSAR